ncbi:integral membrane protein TerC [Vibrio astriarenae]|nr:integral membrane protein TerC [Vibrio sp. C7]
MNSIETVTTASLTGQPVMMYGIFAVLTLAMVGLDIYQTRGGNVTMQKAIGWSVFWFALAFLFAGTIYFFWDVYAPQSDYTSEKATVAF